MKKVFFLMLFAFGGLVLFQNNSFAQSEKKVRTFGVAAGPQLTTITGGDSWKTKIGAQATFRIENLVAINNVLAIAAELGVSLKGAKWEEGDETETYKGSYNFMYIILPILIKYQKDPEGFFAELGVQPSFLVNAKGKEDGESGSYDLKEGMNKFDLGIPVGIGYMFTPKMGVGIRAIIGMSKIFKPTEYSPDDKDKNLVLAAIRFLYNFGN